MIALSSLLNSSSNALGGSLNPSDSAFLSSLLTGFHPGGIYYPPSGHPEHEFPATEFKMEFDVGQITLVLAGESAGYRNSFLGRVNGATPFTIRYDISSPPTTFGEQIDITALLAGSTLEKGDTFDLLLLADGANGGTNLYGMNPGHNPDHFDHLSRTLSTINPVTGTRFYGGGYEDWWNGGDKDFNDAQFIIVLQPTSQIIPEAKTWGTISFIGLVVGYKIYRIYRQKNRR